MKSLRRIRLHTSVCEVDDDLFERSRLRGRAAGLFDSPFLFERSNRCWRLSPPY